MTHKTLNLHVPTLTRVEGEGAMHVTVNDGVVDDVRLEIYEPPRMFEAFLRGRGYAEPVDITARICGICPVAYMMSAVHAMENAAGVRVDGPVRDLRRLLKKLGAPAPGARPFAPRPPDRDAKGRIKAFARTGRGRREVAQAGPATVHVTAWTSLDAGLPANVSVRGSTAPVIRVLKGEDRFLRF